MTIRTRRRLTVLALLALLTLPAESVVWPVFRTPDVGAAARVWAAGLSASERQQMLDNEDLRAYSYEYRRAWMAAANPETRQQAWLDNFQSYIADHPDLNPLQVSIIERAEDLINGNPDMFSGGPADSAVRAQVGDLYVVAVALLPKNAARELFYRLGPDKTIASTDLPLRLRLADSLRRWFVANAAETPACECSLDADCNAGGDHSFYCTDAAECVPNEDYPMCGPLWVSACAGLCHWDTPGR